MEIRFMRKPYETQEGGISLLVFLSLIWISRFSSYFFSEKFVSIFSAESSELMFFLQRVLFLPFLLSNPHLRRENALRMPLFSSFYSIGNSLGRDSESLLPHQIWNPRSLNLTFLMPMLCPLLWIVGRSCENQSPSIPNGNEDKEHFPIHLGEKASQK